MFGIWIGPTAGLVATNHHLWRLAHHTCSSLKVVSLTWYCKSSTKVRMWCRTKSKLHAWETHSRTMIGHCKWWASRRTFGRVWALSSSPPAWLPARLYGWHAIPDNKTPGFWTAFHIPSKASLEPTSQQTTGIPGWTNSCKCASFGWCSTAQAYWKSHAWNPTAVAPRPAQTSTAVVSRWKSKGTCERTLQPSSIHKAIIGAGARTKESTNVCLPQTSLLAPTNLTNWPEGQIVASPTPLSMAKTSTTTVTRDPTIAWDQSGAYKWRTRCAKPCDMTNKVKTNTQTSASATLPELTGIWARAQFKHHRAVAQVWHCFANHAHVQLLNSTTIKYYETKKSIDKKMCWGSCVKRKNAVLWWGDQFPGHRGTVARWEDMASWDVITRTNMEIHDEIPTFMVIYMGFRQSWWSTLKSLGYIMVNSKGNPKSLGQLVWFCID